LAGIAEVFAREGDATGRARMRGFHDAALPLVARFKGRLVRSRADALLAAFASAGAAIEAAVEIARAATELSPRLGVEWREVRVGEDGSVDAESARAAAQVHAQAQPGT